MESYYPGGLGSAVARADSISRQAASEGQKLFVLPLSGYLAYHLVEVYISVDTSKLYRVSTII